MKIKLVNESLKQYAEAVVPDTEEEWEEWRRLRDEGTFRFMGYDMSKLPTDELERFLRGETP